MARRIIETAKEDLFVPAPTIVERVMEDRDGRSQGTRIRPSEVCECSQDSQPTTASRSARGTQGHELRGIHFFKKNIENSFCVFLLDRSNVFFTYTFRCLSGFWSCCHRPLLPKCWLLQGRTLGGELSLCCVECGFTAVPFIGDKQCDAMSRNWGYRYYSNFV